MSFKKTLFFFLIFAFIGIYYYLIEIKQTEKRKEIEQEEKRVFSPIKKEEISEVKIEKENKTIRLIKINNNWKIKEPVEADVDQESLKIWLDYVAKLPKERIVLKAAENIDEFGLDKPAFSVQVKAANAGPITLVSGDEIPTGSMFYSKLKNKNTVFLIAAYNKNGIDKTVYELRDKMIFHFDKDNVNKIQFIFPDKTITAVRNEEKNWEIIEPKKVRADDFEINTLLNDIKDSKIIDFIPEHPNDKKQKDTFALKNPRLTVKVFEKDVSEPKFISFGSDNQPREAVYANTGNQDEFVLVAKEFFNKLNITDITLRNKYLLILEEDKIACVQIETEGKEYLITNSKDGWALNKPENKKLDNLKAKEILWSLGDIKFIDIINETGEGDLAAFGLEKPAIKVSLLDEKEINLESIFIGAEIKDKDLLYAMTDKSKTIYSIDLKFKDELINNLNNLLTPPAAK